MNALSDAQTLNRVSWAESSSLLDMPQNRDKLTWQLECKEEVFSANVVVHIGERYRNDYWKGAFVVSYVCVLY